LKEQVSLGHVYLRIIHKQRHLAFFCVSCTVPVHKLAIQSNAKQLLKPGKLKTTPK